MNSVCWTLSWTAYELQQKIISTENLELWRDSLRIPTFIFVAIENLELWNNEQRHYFYFVSSASVIFFASGLDVGLEETFFNTQDLQ